MATDIEEEVEDAPQEAAPEQIANIDDLLSADDLEPVYVALPRPYVGGVRVRPLTMEEISQAQRAATHRVRSPDGQGWVQETSADDINKEMVLRSLVEPGLTPAQYDALMKKNYGLMTTILAAVTSINGISLDGLQGVIQEVTAQFRG